MDAQEVGNWQNGLKPSNLDKNLDRLNKEADRVRKVQFKYKKKDGTEGSVNLNLKK
jgi:hypothetical protein